MDRETQFHTSKNDKNGFEGFSLFNPSEGLTRVLSFAVKEVDTALFTFSASQKMGGGGHALPESYPCNS
jgi:hypothetical protein